jgi:DNA repair protein RadD
MMLTHVKELIEQNAEKMRQHWPGAPMGIYSAGMRRKQLGEPITFAGIQSIWSKSSRVGHIDICIIDECHLVNHKAIGMYRAFLDALLVINPSMRVVGLTATPYRLGHGLITDKPAIFDDLLDPVTIEELIQKGFLAPLSSKVTKTNYDLSGVHSAAVSSLRASCKLPSIPTKTTTPLSGKLLPWPRIASHGCSSALVFTMPTP